MARTLTATIQRLRRTIGRGGAIPDIDPALPAKDWHWLHQHIALLLTADDTSTQRAAIAVVADVYRRLDDTGRTQFLRGLAAEFGIDGNAARAAAKQLLDAPLGDIPAQVDVRLALTPPYASLLHLFTGLDEGVKFLVDLRADLRRLTKTSVPLLDHELAGHLATLFDLGLLELHRITWDSPASLLEKLIRYEAVHQIDGWDDLRDRLDTDRRCFAFIHPAMPDEPVVFVEIALVAGPPTSMAVLLDQSAPAWDPADADTAVFYSITSCQAGLAGINLGNELIKTVVAQLHREFPRLDRFVTLSPIPTLRRGITVADDVRRALDAGDWTAAPDADPDLRHATLAAAARYLTTAIDGRVPDPVGNFHLSNGARVEAVRWAANLEGYGLDRSWGVMVSYRYDPPAIAERARRYAAGEPVSTSDEIRKLVASERASS